MTLYLLPRYFISQKHKNIIMKKFKTFIFNGLTIIKLESLLDGKAKTQYFKNEPGADTAASISINGKKFYPSTIGELRKIGLPDVQIKK
jgi:hypothetical protein